MVKLIINHRTIWELAYFSLRISWAVAVFIDSRREKSEMVIQENVAAIVVVCVGQVSPNKREIERSEKQSQRWQHAMLGREMFRRFGELPLLQGMSPASAMAKLFVDIGLGFVTRGLA